jgi:maltooligosyltrehalose trehalohydrolase
MLFMGEEFGAREPFLFFTDFAGALGVAVREGRRREFAGTPGFTDEEAWHNIPDPNDIQTFGASAWTRHSSDAGEWRALTECLLRLRHEIIVPRLTGTRSLGAAAVNAACVRATWRMGNDDVLTLICNLGPVPVTLDHPPGPPLFGVHPKDGEIGPYSTLAWIST